MYNKRVILIVGFLMEPAPPISKPIFLFVEQARRAATPTLSENVEKITNSQIALALKVIQNTNNLWDTYQTGSDPKMEKELNHIVMVLSGATEGRKSGFSLQDFLQSKGSRIEFRDKQIANLVNAINSSELNLIQPYIIEERTTSELITHLMGTELKTDKELTHQLFRDYSALLNRVKINGNAVKLTLPSEKPPSWKDLIPAEVSDFIGGSPTLVRDLALLMTQGIAAEPFLKARELIHDPLMPEATFESHNSYPTFDLSKVNNTLFLTVTTKGFLGVMAEDESKKIAIRHYDMTQVIDLTNPETKVKLTIKQRA